MDPQNAAETFKLLEKQNELLEDAHRKMSHELHRLQVEEEMLMRKCFVLTSALGWNKKKELSVNDVENEEPKMLANIPSEGNNDFVDIRDEISV